MYGKKLNKKIWKNGAAVFTIFVIMSSYIAFPAIANTFSKSSPFAILIHESEPWFKDKPSKIHIELLGGVPPFNITIDWDDGTTNDSWFLTNERLFDKSHFYPRVGEYNITVMANDNDTNASKDIAIMPTKVSGYVVDLEITVKTSKETLLFREGESILLEIEVISYQGQFTYCPDYDIGIYIDPCNVSYTIKGGEIQPGHRHKHAQYCCDGCKRGPNTVYVNVTTKDSEDKNLFNNVDSTTYIILPTWAYDILDQFESNNWIVTLINRIVGL